MMAYITFCAWSSRWDKGIQVKGRYFEEEKKVKSTCKYHLHFTVIF